MNIEWCVRCLYPNTKPNLVFNEKGVCAACQSFDSRREIDWHQRADLFVKYTNDLRSTNKGFSPYDCIIPVSGGKDSHFQVIKALEYGLTPLAVTATTDDLSLIGRRNLNNIARLGVDHIEVTVNPIARRRIAAHGLRSVGDISWAEHITIFTVPVREAFIRKIPLIIWGENPQNEYGAPYFDAADEKQLLRSWLNEFGGLNGLRIKDFIEMGLLNIQESYQYLFPYDEDCKDAPKGIFLGQFFQWDGNKNAEIASKYGFERNPGPVEGCGVDYENLDNYQTGIHDYFKYIKFGFGRATDIACNLIRRNIITRQEGKEFIMEFDGQFPRSYLGQPLEKTLDKIHVGLDEFMVICDTFTNYDVFEKRRRFSPRPTPKFNILNA